MSMNQVWRPKIWTKLSLPQSRKKGMITALIRCIQQRKRKAARRGTFPSMPASLGTVGVRNMPARDSATRPGRRRSGAPQGNKARIRAYSLVEPIPSHG